MGAAIGAAAVAGTIAGWQQEVTATPMQALQPLFQLVWQPHAPHDPQLDPHEVQDEVQHVLQHELQQPWRQPQRRPQANAGPAAANDNNANTVSTVPKRRMTQSSSVKK